MDFAGKKLRIGDKVAIVVGYRYATSLQIATVTRVMPRSVETETLFAGVATSVKKHVVSKEKVLKLCDKCAEVER